MTAPVVPARPALTWWFFSFLHLLGAVLPAMARSAPPSRLMAGVLVAMWPCASTGTEALAWLDVANAARGTMGETKSKGRSAICRAPMMVICQEGCPACALPEVGAVPAEAALAPCTVPVFRPLPLPGSPRVYLGGQVSGSREDPPSPDLTLWPTAMCIPPCTMPTQQPCASFTSLAKPSAKEGG